MLLYYFVPRSINCCAAQCCAKPSRERGREGGAVKLYKIRCAKSCAIQSGAHLGAKRKKQSAMQCKTEQKERERGAELKRRSFSNGSLASFDASQHCWLLFLLESVETRMSRDQGVLLLVIIVLAFLSVCV